MGLFLACASQALSGCACEETPRGDKQLDESSMSGDADQSVDSRNQQAATDPTDEPPPTPPPLPRVDLSGKNQPLAVSSVEPGPRVYARSLKTWIFEKPDSSSRKLGYLRAGSSTPTKDKPTSRRGCKGGWYPVRPQGFVCVGPHATLDREDPTVRLFEEHPPRTDQRLPYRYGIVRKPGPIFTHLPKLDELTQVEPDFEERFPTWLSADGEIGAKFRQDIWEWGRAPIEAAVAWQDRLTRGVPDLLQLDKVLPSPTLTPRPETLILGRMDARVGHSFLDTFFSEGRRYGLTTYLEVVPTDRYRPIEGSAYHGVEVGREVSFPFAFVRRVGSKYSDGSKADYRDILELTGKKKFINDRLHYETSSGKYISDLYASEVTEAKSMPGWAKKGEKWISISISKQVMVLYEGTKAVYATLVSSGEAGLDSADETTATKRGIFRVHTKHISSTMASDESGEEFELRDVPYVQYFAEGGYALHGAYWHDRFGTPKSHGCINLAPEDARRVFFWTDPPVPVGWHGALSPLRGTVVFIHP